jgi:uncharacterized membrane protein
MSENSVFFLAVGIGIVAGLRALTAPAAVSWAARLGWLNRELAASGLDFYHKPVKTARRKLTI